MDSGLTLGHIHLEKQELQDVSCLAVGPFGIQAMAVAHCWPRPCQNMCNHSHCPPSWPDVSLELFLAVAAPLIRNQADGKVILSTENCLNQGCHFELTVWGGWDFNLLCRSKDIPAREKRSKQVNANEKRTNTLLPSHTCTVMSDMNIYHIYYIIINIIFNFGGGWQPPHHINGTYIRTSTFSDRTRTLLPLSGLGDVPVQSLSLLECVKSRHSTNQNSTHNQHYVIRRVTKLLLV